MLSARFAGITAWFDRFNLHAAMDIALEITELNVYSYGGPDGADELTVDIEEADNAVRWARKLAPAYTHADLDYTLRQINLALYSDDDVDARLYMMRCASEAVHKADHAMRLRSKTYRAIEAAI